MDTNYEAVAFDREGDVIGEATGTHPDFAFVALHNDMISRNTTTRVHDIQIRSELEIAEQSLEEEGIDPESMEDQEILDAYNGVESPYADEEADAAAGHP